MDKNLERLIRIMGTFDLATGHAETMEEALDSLESELRDVLGFYREQYKRQPLSDDEIVEMWGESYSGNTLMLRNFVRAIEAAHGIGVEE